MQTSADHEQPEPRRVSSGIPGLDSILGGGLPANRLYLVKGTSGVGKTTLALQFLLEGAARKEAVLYVTLSETRSEIEQVADSHGWSLDGLALYELSTTEHARRLEETNTLYATADVELKETIRVLLNEVDRIKPSRVVFDSLSEIRLLAQGPFRYRRQLLALKQYFAGRHCTVLLLDDSNDHRDDVQVESLAHGVVLLEQLAVQYGADRRRVRVSKVRATQYRTGHHDFVIKRGGLVVFPRLIAAEHRGHFIAEALRSGIAELDELLGGGLDRGTSTLITGPAGVGKSSLAAQFACAEAARGSKAALFLFEERPATVRIRTDQLGMSLSSHANAGRIRLHQVDPAELAPDEFTHLVRTEIEQGARVVVIDSIVGYFSAMPEARFLPLRLHEMLTFAGERGVAVFLTLGIAGITGPTRAPVDISYLADNVIVLRYFEAAGRVRKAISVVKKRAGAHENTIRELTLGSSGITVGAPLIDFNGVLTGVPTFTGKTGTLRGDLRSFDEDQGEG
jgi:circadian clock protein KaiC